MATSHFFILLPFLLSFSTLTLSDRCHPDDKKALLKLKKDLKNPYDFVSWDPKIDCCEWNAVECDEKTNRIITVAADPKPHPNFPLPPLIPDLNVSLPPSIGNLPYLQSLIFHKTNLTGQIPEAITKLTRLRFIDMRWNHLTGPVPSFLSQLKELTYIGLSFNRFTGSIPASLAQLPNLGGLLLDRNNLTGSIPESFADFQVKDFYLYLSHNQLSGPIPAKLGYTNFSLIDVSRNKLEGDISFLFGTNKSLNSAYFSRNSLQFDMSKIKAFPKTLQNLDLNHNKITGSLPKALANLELSYLNVSYNRLCGQIPVSESLQRMTSYEYFHNKCLCGAPLPACK